MATRLKSKLCVSALIWHNESLLLVRREKKPYLNRWTLPGGHVNPGETVDEAIKREVLEETGFSVECCEQQLFQYIKKSVRHTSD